MENDKLQRGEEAHIAEAMEPEVMEKEAWQHFDTERFLTDAAFFLVNSQMKMADIAMKIAKECRPNNKFNLIKDDKPREDNPGDDREAN